MKFLIKTYGCQMNERDTEAVGALLVRHGHSVATEESLAGLVIVNTCSVRGKAEAKALGKLGLLVAGKRHNPDRIVGSTGCMVQRLGESVFDKVPGLDFAVGPNRLPMIPAIIDLVKAGKGPVLDVGSERGREADVLTGHADSGVSAFVNILLGCNRRCSYCIVPAVRGAEWSRSAESVVAEVKGLAAGGVKEVTLLGQSVLSYGRSNAVWPAEEAPSCGYREPLIRLLAAVDAVPGIERVRFTSGHPSGCSTELACAMQELPTVCEHIHLPVQSGSDRMLKLMRRDYTTDKYRRAVDRLRGAMPGIAVTTDVIVGFPTETAEDFEMTRDFMEEIGFDNAFIFKYSPRPATPAAELVDDVSGEEKLRRNKVLLKDQETRGLKINGGLAGSTVEVLVAGVSARNPARWSGRTRTNKITVFEPRDGLKEGDLVKVNVSRGGPQTLYGDVAQKE